ncbi:MAG TPA: hypothetical protein VKV02_08310, partial [Acidobacteriaceae bacterium]|nr:hypothetical protein [Acidobacteriaceae bacterium]
MGSFSRCSVLLLSSSLAGRLLAAVLGASLCGAAQAQAPAAATAADPLLQAMQDELAREREQLVLPGMLRPYFIEYRLEDIHNYELVANYGA